MGHYTQILGQMIDLELSHILWALVAIIGYFIRRELVNIHEDVKRMDSKISENTIDIVKIKTHLEIE